MYSLEKYTQWVHGMLSLKDSISDRITDRIENVTLLYIVFENRSVWYKFIKLSYQMSFPSLQEKFPHKSIGQKKKENNVHC